MKKLILLHGALGASVQFEYLSKELKKYYEIYTIDFDGHGESDVVVQEFGIEHFAKNLDDFIIKNKLFGADVFGYSMGGYVGLYHQLIYPNTLGSIITLATKFNWNPENSEKEAKMLNADKLLEKIPKYAEELESLHRSKWRKLLSQTAEMMINLGNSPLLNFTNLPNIENNIRICVGDKDVMVTIEESLNVYKLLKNSTFAVLPNTIHPLGKVNLERLSFEIKNFLG